MSMITMGLGKDQKLITQGLGGLYRVEIVEIPAAVPYYQVKVFKKEIPVVGTTVHKLVKEIEVRGIKDFKMLLYFLLLDEDENYGIDIDVKLDPKMEIKLLSKWIQQFKKVKKRTDIEGIARTLKMKFKKKKKE